MLPLIVLPLKTPAKKGKGWGGWWVRWGQAKGPASQCASVCQTYHLATTLEFLPDESLIHATLRQTIAGFGLQFSELL